MTYKQKQLKNIALLVVFTAIMYIATTIFVTRDVIQTTGAIIICALSTLAIAVGFVQAVYGTILTHKHPEVNLTEREVNGKTMMVSGFASWVVIMLIFVYM